MVLVVLGIPNLVVLAGLTAVVAVLGRARLLSRRSGADTSWADAWLKALIIVVFAIFFVAYLPSRLLQTGTVATMSRSAQDLIGSATWGLALVVLLAGLWYARRNRVV